MAKISIKFFVTVKNDDGTERYYWQPSTPLRKQGWKSVRLSALRHEAMSQAEERNNMVQQWRAGMIDIPVATMPGSVAALILDYKKSRHYKSLSEKSRKDYDYYLRLIDGWAGDMQVTIISKKMVQDLYEVHREAHPRKAAFIIQVLRIIFSHAERQSIIPPGSNPAAKPNLQYRADKGILWQPEAVERFVAMADDMGHFSIGTGVMLNEWLGQRRVDLIKIPMSAYRDGAIHIRQGKRGAEVILPVDMVPALKERIEAQIDHNRKRKTQTPGTILIQQGNGQGYTDEGFMSLFERVREKLGEDIPALAKLQFMHLRHTAVTRLAEAGAEIPQIAAITGHSFKACQEIIDRYNIRTRKMAQQAFQHRITAEGNSNAETA